MTSRVMDFVSRRWRVPRPLIRVRLQPLPGGLESTVVLARISIRGDRPSIPRQLVVKQLSTGAEREADVYELLWRHLERPPAVRMLGREVCSGVTYLYLERALPASRWPWSDMARSGAVCRELALLHATAKLPAASFGWSYEAELACSARSTLTIARDSRDASGQRHWRRLGDLRRVIAALPHIRRTLLAGTTTIIHGDVHPGNVILSDGGRHREVLLIDWGRARVGHYLEDVTSWLHSLGCWEPEARRRHDTLMRMYLDASPIRRRFDADMRATYWLASASNGLSGAIRYHLAVLSDTTTTTSARDNSRVALSAWERVVRRAATFLTR